MLLTISIFVPVGMPMWSRWANDHDLQHLQAKAVLLYWSEFTLWLQSYGICRVWPRPMDGQTDGDNFVVPIYLPKGRGTKSQMYYILSVICYTKIYICHPYQSTFNVMRCDVMFLILVKWWPFNQSWNHSSDKNKKLKLVHDNVFICFYKYYNIGVRLTTNTLLTTKFNIMSAWVFVYQWGCICFLPIGWGGVGVRMAALVI